MKVLVFTTLYPNHLSPNFGVFVKERMTSFARWHGHEVMVVAPVPYYPPIKLGARWKYSQIKTREEVEGLEVYHPRYFMTPKVGMSTYGMTMFLSVLPLIKRIQRKFDFDLIDSHYVYPDGFAAIKLGEHFNKPVVVSARGSDINLFARFPIIRRLLRHTLAHAEHVIAVCQALKDAMMQLGAPAEKISVIPNGVDASKFYPRDKEESRRALNLPEKRIILSVGELIPRKGFHVLIKALKLCLAQRGVHDLCLVIVGEGAYRNELEKLIAELQLEEHVKLVGAQPHAELRRWYSAADYFCLASEREGWPNVVLEALACGTPVIATKVWGIPEIITSEAFGILTNRNEEDLAQALARAMNTAWNKAALVQYARERTWEKVARAVEETFEMALVSHAAQTCRTKKEVLEISS
ncbi:glycosyltransferase family 4 protein [candidate division KSB1 bacterium]|nr:glycosyltransferase family 4 protein [candidate division KSB1 bacterium]